MSEWLFLYKFKVTVDIKNEKGSACETWMLPAATKS